MQISEYAIIEINSIFRSGCKYFCENFEYNPGVDQSLPTTFDQFMDIFN